MAPSTAYDFKRMGLQLCRPIRINLSSEGGFYTFAKIALNVALGRSAASAFARSGL